MAFKSNSEAQINNLSAAIVDGRCRNIRYRQKQLHALHATLSQHSDSVCSAIERDTSLASLEVETVYFWTLDAVRQNYERLNLKDERKAEFLVAEGKDDIDRQIGIGLAVIRPAVHTRLYSIVAPIAAAIAAGNCILLEADPSNFVLDSVLQPIFADALDQDTFQVSIDKIDTSKLPYHVLVDQTGSSKFDATKSYDLSSSPKTRTIAIVDRTADVETAAKEIVTARFSYQGNSPYAPDLVIVNEFVHQQFFEACTTIASKLFAKSSQKSKEGSSPLKEVKSTIQEAEKKGELIAFGSADFKIMDIQDRTSKVAHMKISGTYLAVLSCSSLTDAISLSDADAVLSASYLFCDPETAKFVGQNINCHLTYVNHIPLHLLLGPASPLTHPIASPHRYHRNLFSLTRPQFSTQSYKNSSILSKALRVSRADGNPQAQEKELRKLALVPLKPLDQPPGHAIGFFEQGIITGATVILCTTVVPTVIYGGWKIISLAQTIRSRR